MDENKNNQCDNDCGNCTPGRLVQRPEKITNNLCTRLNRIEGQVKGIRNMIEKGVYCDDILTQIAAVQSAMSSVAKLLLQSHVKTCITKRLKEGDEEVVEELIQTIGRLL